MVAQLVKLKFVCVFFNLVLKLSLQIGAVVLELQDLLALLENQGFKLSDPKREVLLREGTCIALSVDLAVTRLKSHLLLKNRDLVEQLLLSLLHLLEKFALIATRKLAHSADLRLQSAYRRQRHSVCVVTEVVRLLEAFRYKNVVLAHHGEARSSFLSEHAIALQVLVRRAAKVWPDAPFAPEQFFLHLGKFLPGLKQLIVVTLAHSQLLLQFGEVNLHVFDV